MERLGDPYVNFAGWWFPIDDPKKDKIVTWDGFRILHDALRHVDNWKVAIDGGAHIGKTALALSDRFEKVIAVELAPDTTDCLRRNLQNRKNVTILNACLGDKPGMVGYESDRVKTSSVRRVVPGCAVQRLTIDELAFDYGFFKAEEVGFIKLDLQGYDFLALKGAGRVIRESKPIIMFENLHRCYKRYEITSEEIQDWLDKMGLVKLGGKSDAIYR